jgi:four helix bundle protein
MKIERFQDLKSWQEARKLVQIIYRMTRNEAFKSDRALGWQLEAAAVSTMGNIAEGHGRYSFEDKRRFLDISLGSCKEVQSHLYVALDQTFIAKSEFEEAYGQSEIVAQLVTGSSNNLELQIARRPPSRTRQRRDRQGFCPVEHSNGRTVEQPNVSDRDRLNNSTDSITQ